MKCPSSKTGLGNSYFSVWQVNKGNISLKYGKMYTFLDFKHLLNLWDLVKFILKDIKMVKKKNKVKQH